MADYQLCGHRPLSLVKKGRYARPFFMLYPKKNGLFNARLWSENNLHRENTH